ncbi:MAG: DUF2909 domain-containing protein [Chromatiales bacterium]
MRPYAALTLRVALSIGLFVLLMIAYATGWLTPVRFGKRPRQRCAPAASAGRAPLQLASN